MELNELMQLITTNGFTLVVCGVILFGLYRGVPQFCKWIGEKIDQVIQSQLKKDEEIIKSIKEIQKNNTVLCKAIDKIEVRVEKLEKTTDEILEEVTK